MGAIDLTLTINGVSSATIGCYVTPLPNRQKALRVQELRTVPGKNGAVVIDNAYYPNVDQEYEFYVPIANEVKFSSWLNYSGYARLVDSYYPKHFRLAKVNGYSVVDDRARNQIVVTVTFSCKPHWFRIDGETAKSFTSGTGTYTYIDLTNTGNSNARPLIMLRPAAIGNYEIAAMQKPSGSSSYAVKGLISVSVDVLNTGINTNLYIDCESRSMYKTRNNVATNLNMYVNCSDDFPELFAEGSIRIRIKPPSGASFTGSITPRWRDLL